MVARTQNDHDSCVDEEGHCKKEKETTTISINTKGAAATVVVRTSVSNQLMYSTMANESTKTKSTMAAEQSAKIFPSTNTTGSSCCEVIDIIRLRACDKGTRELLNPWCLQMLGALELTAYLSTPQSASNHASSIV